MLPIECEFEKDVLAAVVEGQWPALVSPELREHAAHCEVCAGTAAVASAVNSARLDLRPLVVVPDSGRVWWLAQLRARREDVKSAVKPITAAQSIAGACAVGILGACFGATSSWFQETLRWAAGNLSGSSAIDLLMRHGTVAAGIGAVLFLVPAAAWLALKRD